MSAGAIADGPAALKPRATPRDRARATSHTRFWWAAAFVVLLVVVSQGLDMLHYPYLEDDEGTYLAQAWAVFHLGRLTPYTYIYDHAPLGWIQIAIWQLLTFGRFGSSVTSGRVLMLVYQVGSALLVLATGRRASGKVWVGLLAACLFSLSSYGIYYHRRILLDNVATFWILVSLYLLVERPTLSRIWLSGVAIGIAVLSKETAIAVMPALLLIAARRTPRPARLFGVFGWLALAASVCSTYVLIALLKGELFKPGTLLGGSSPTSASCARSNGSRRGATTAGCWTPRASSGTRSLAWAHAEPLLVIGGTGAALIAITVLRRDAIVSGIGLAVLLAVGVPGARRRRSRPSTCCRCSPCSR